MKHLIVILIIFGNLFMPRNTALAQDSFSSSQAKTLRSEAPYLLPQTIFVGDSGRLVVPLGQAFFGMEPFVLDNSGIFPESPFLVLKRIELEKRGGVTRLLIDFIPYAPGTVPFPVLDLNSLKSGQTGSEEGAELPSITGLEVQVASILNPSQMTLSDPAPPLAAPGTSFLVYGSFVLLLVILFLGTGLSLWGRRHFRELWERFRRRRLIRLMAKFLRRLRQESGFEKDGKARYYLTILSGEFREFLSLFTGVNCYSLSAEEFRDLSLGYESEIRSPGILSPVFLCGIFRSWDTLRFSGRNIEMSDMFQALYETESFVAALEKAEKEKPLPKSIRKSGSEQNFDETDVSIPAAAGGEGF